MARRKLVAGNWKLNGSLALCEELVAPVADALARLDAIDCAVFPPSPYLVRVRELAGASRLAWGAQDVSQHEAGAHTGEVSAAMLHEFGCRFALCGHSERRADHGESSALVARKAAAAIAGGVTPVVCVGETLADREGGRTESVVLEQLGAVLATVAEDDLAKLVIAYEPVWAIGTGVTATPAQAQEVHALIRAQIAAVDAAVAAGLTILYGGSVKGANAAELFAMADIDGALVGGASLTAEQFLPICEAAQELARGNEGTVVPA